MTNDECELYEFSLYTICELHTNHELCITNREYAHSVAALSDSYTFSLAHMQSVMYVHVRLFG